MPGIRQTNFGAGEFDERLWGRQDLKSYLSASRKLINFFPSPAGSILSRPGTYYVNNTKNDQPVRLIPFNYADIADQNYILEFGDQYVRFHTSLGTVESAPGVPYEVVTPYLAADLARLKYVQVGDVITIVHPKYAPRELKRLGHTNWTLSSAVLAATSRPSFGPVIETDPLFYPVADATHVAKPWQWIKTCVFRDGTESLPSPYAEAAHNGSATSGMIACYTDRPVYLWIPGEPLPNMVQFNIYKGRDGIFGLVGVASTGTLTYASGASITGLLFVDDGIEPDYSLPPPSSVNRFDVLPWAANTFYEAGELVTNGGNLYRCRNPGYSAGSVGPTGVSSGITDGASPWQPSTIYAPNTRVTNRGRTYIMSGLISGTSAALPATGPWGYASGGFVDNTCVWGRLADKGAVLWDYVSSAASVLLEYPATVAIFEQRRVFGGTENSPSTIFGSSPDRYEKFSVPQYSTVKATDPIEFDIASRRREQIRSLVGLRHLMALTNSSEWVVGGAANGDPMSPFSIRARAHSEHGSSWLDPLVIGNTLIHVQPKGTVVRDMYFDVNIDSYTGNELSIFSKHFFRGHDIVSWAYAEDPYSVVWAARDDGKLLSMTYVREQELFAWAQHETQGSVEQVCSIPEGFEDSVYFVVLRDGQRFIERQSTREFATAGDSHCVDAGILYTGGSATVPGLAHLEGRVVSALVDGDVVENLTVVGGTVTLPNAGTKVHVGLPYTCSWEALDVAQDRERQKIVKEVLIDFVGSRGIWVGESLDDLAGWTEWPNRNLVAGFGSLPLSTGTARLTVSARWGLGGRAAVQQRAPLPLTIVALQRELAAGGS